MNNISKVDGLQKITLALSKKVDGYDSIPMPKLLDIALELKASTESICDLPRHNKPIGWEKYTVITESINNFRAMLINVAGETNLWYTYISIDSILNEFNTVLQMQITLEGIKKI